MAAFSSLLFVLLSATPLYATFYDSLAALPETDFDFIVVGGECRHFQHTHILTHEKAALLALLLPAG
jgi:BarA-like signal transduction histidine kinase